jgi:hypothetical protein
MSQEKPSMPFSEDAAHTTIAGKLIAFFWQKKWWLLMPIIGVLLLLAATAIFDFSKYLVFFLHE